LCKHTTLPHHAAQSSCMPAAFQQGPCSNQQQCGRPIIWLSTCLCFHGWQVPALLIILRLWRLLKLVRTTHEADELHILGEVHPHNLLPPGTAGHLRHNAVMTSRHKASSSVHDNTGSTQVHHVTIHVHTCPTCGQQVDLPHQNDVPGQADAHDSISQTA
jgi:hypothetical protein